MVFVERFDVDRKPPISKPDGAALDICQDSGNEAAGDVRLNPQ